MSLQTPLLPPHDPEASASVSPVVDLETGGVIALHVPPGASELAPGTLPLLLDLPTHMVIRGSGALAPLHEALRRSGRRPREVILKVHGPCQDADRRALLVGLDGLRAIGHLVAFGGMGVGSLPMELVTEAAPYLIVLAPELVARVPDDHRRTAVGEALATLARGIGAHVLTPGITGEAQLATVRSWGVRLAEGPLLRPGPDGRVRVPLPVRKPSRTDLMLGPRVQELLLPAVTLPERATSEEVVEAFGTEPSITSVILVDEYQRPEGSLDRSRFLLSIAGRYGHALHGKKPALRLADPPRTVPRTTPAIAAMQVAGQDSARVYDDLVVTDEVGRCLGVVRVSDLMRAATGPYR
ncbi:EAL domain-containing protein [Nonomuraea dietziae]|uniref:EAL domain-containing protein (Putative c-di-GMP-specific phosphodiesterase class I) n=1 Tax=Nonomuraea dietziae TaxID=65515 RepID=A0A7W5VA97_9ACTN|nr:EAL domain-containing protein [Nonomuraea dietziae]MBB3733531.1 EAL domain-containing protein (putative c-di-GMP-specific phosphodiesterase class I) [Nonomuraea dietziae]